MDLDLVNILIHFQSNNSTETLLPFALGIELAQILIVLAVISINQIFSKKNII